jgi:hypothetical protein
VYARDIVIDQSTHVVQYLPPPAVPIRPVKLSPPAPHLAGREGLLFQINGRLTAAGSWPRVLALHGLGGAGKTSIAVEYARRHEGEYGLIWELAAEEPTVLVAGFAQLALVLGLRDSADGLDPVDSVHAALAARIDSWLLILDNAPDEAAVRNVLPPVGRGHVLITSRSAAWSDIIGVEVPVLERQAATEYLLARAGEADAQAAGQLVDALGALPLALAQAAAYIAQTGRTLTEYLSLLGAHRAQLLARGEVAGYAGRVASTWEIAFTRLRTTHPSSVALLQLLACYAPEAIPIGLLMSARGNVFEDIEIEAVLRPLLGEDPLALDDAIVGLRRYSLIGSPGRGLASLHRLVQAVTLDHLASDRRSAWREAAGHLLEAALPARTHDPLAWPIWAVLLPHALAVLDPLRPGINRIIEYSGAIGDFPTAKRLQEEVYVAAVDRLGAEHRDTLRARGGIARWIGQGGEPARARDLLRELLATSQRVLGPDDPVTLWVAAHLADWTGQSGDWALARDMCLKVLPERRRVSGDEDADTIWIWHETGFWVGQAGDAAGACVYYEEFLPVAERVLGADHFDLLSFRNEYARFIGQSGDPARARDLCATLAAQITTGAEHPSTLWIRANLAWWTGKAGDAAGARDQFRELVPVWARVLGPEHPFTLVAWSNFAYWTGLAGDPASARDEYAAMLPIRRRVLGEDHPETLLMRENLARWTLEAGDLAAARDQYAALLASYEQAFGPDDEGTIRALSVVAE